MGYGACPTRSCGHDDVGPANGVQPIITFPPFQLDAGNADLRRGALRIPLRPQALAVLQYLAERPGRLVPKDELLDTSIHRPLGMPGHAAASARGVRGQCSEQFGRREALLNRRGFAAPEVERTDARALQLCRTVGDARSLFPVREGLHSYYAITGELRTVCRLAARMARLGRASGHCTQDLATHHTLSG